MGTRIKHGLWLVAASFGTSSLLASSAAAQSSSVGTYGGEGANAAANIALNASGSADPSSASGSAASGGLPFTGMDVMLALGGGILLLLAGLALARILQPQVSA